MAMARDRYSSRSPTTVDFKELSSVECGKEAAKHYDFDPDFRNLNHGSFGTYPIHIRPVLHHYQQWAEARPDDYIRFEYPRLLDESRAAIAKHVNAPVSSCVFVPNSTTGVNIVLRNLEWAPGDVIIYFATIYGSCEKTVTYMSETTAVEGHKIRYTYPVSDAFLIHALESAVDDLRAEGKTPRLAIFDTVVSMPGLRMPFEELTRVCRAKGIFSLIDGAHGIGHLPLDLSVLDPDFFVSNCHKWLDVPRSCALFYVPERNQALIRSSLPTSHGFVPKPKDGAERIFNPLPPTGDPKSPFEINFEFVGTLDSSPYLCVPTALAWREKLTWGDKTGDEAHMGYCHDLAQKGGKLVAKKLSTEILSNEGCGGQQKDSLGECCMTNVRLPLEADVVLAGTAEFAIDVGKVAAWIARTLVSDYDTFIPVFFYAGAWWTRLSAQVYLVEDDFAWAADTLKAICQRVEKVEWRGAPKDAAAVTEELSRQKL